MLFKLLNLNFSSPIISMPFFCSAIIYAFFNYIFYATSSFILFNSHPFTNLDYFV